MELLTLLADNWKELSGVAALIATWHKDAIANKLNIRQKKADVKRSEKSVDTVYIQNSEKLVELYSKSMDDLNTKHADSVRQMESRMEEMEVKHDKEVLEIKQQHQANLNEFKEQATIEKGLLKKTVDKLQQEVTKLTELVERLGRQIAFYKQHSDLELPDDLQD